MESRARKEIVAPAQLAGVADSRQASNANANADPVGAAVACGKAGSCAQPPARFGKLIAAALLGGAVVGLWLPILLPAFLCWMSLAVGLSLWARSRAWHWLGALLVGLAWAQLQAGWTLQTRLPPEWEGREVGVSGQVVGLPEHETRRTRFRLRVADDPANPEVLRGRTVQLAWYDPFGSSEVGSRSSVRAGGYWQMQVKVRPPRGLSNPGSFDAERHALARRISAMGVIRGEPQPLAAARGIDAWRERMAERIAARTPPTSARYVQALAVGDTRGLDDGDWEILRATGLTHLIAISGFHVGLVAGFFALLGSVLWRVFPGVTQLLPRPLAAAMLALSGALAYAAVAGFALPTVRTVLMIAVVVLARCGKRPFDVGASLALALIAMLVVDSLAVLQAGFWLSFAGVAWLAWCLPSAGPRLHWLRGFLAAQGVATLGLLPLTVMLFGQASLAGPLANLVAIPWWSLVVVPLALIGTALEAMHVGWGGWAWQLAGSCFDLSWPLFKAMAASRFALWWLPESGAIALLLAMLGAFWGLLPWSVPGKGLALLLWLPLLWPMRLLPAQGEVELQVLDVGQGLAVLVRTARHQLLYDAGPVSKDGFDAGERVVVPALRASGVRRLDRMVISHADADHAGGATAVMAVMPTKGVQGAPQMPDVRAEPCVAGDAWQWDGVHFRYLHPPTHFPYLRNESSCVLRIEIAHGAVLLAGDIGHVVEQGLVARLGNQLRADVLVVPHHGSSGSSHPSFVQAVRPRLAIVSSGHGNRFGHPRAEVVQRWRASGAEVLVTADSGAVRVWLGKAGLKVRERRRWRAHLWEASGVARPAAILSPIQQAAVVPEG